MSARARLLLPLGVLLLALAGPTVPTSAGEGGDGCPPGIGIGLLQFPRERADDPRAQSYVIDHVAPGASFRRQFQVCNGTSGPLTAQLYATDASVRGGSFLPAAGRVRAGIAAAITVQPSSLALDAGQAGVATAVFALPRDAPPGEHYAVIFAEVDGASAPVQARSRAGIRVYLDVGPGGEKPSDFVVDSLQGVRQRDGSPAVVARVTNTGARALDLAGALSLTDGPGGLSGGPFDAQLGTTLGVGQSGPVTVPLADAIRGGPWLATLTLRSGLLERRAEARVTFPDASGAEGPAVQAKNLPLRQDPAVVVPIAAGVLGLALLLLLLALLRSRRRRHDDKG